MSIEHPTDELPAELPGETLETFAHTSRQRGPRTDPSMRDGDSSHGNPYEMEGNDFDTDNDTGDAQDEPVHAGRDGGVSAGTTADLRNDRESTDFSLAPEVEEVAGGDSAAERGRGNTRKGRGPRDAAADNLPIDGYQRLTVEEIARKVRSLSPDELKRIRAFEAKHRNRKTLLTRLEQMMESSGEGKHDRRPQPKADEKNRMKRK